MNKRKSSVLFIIFLISVVAYQLFYVLTWPTNNMAIKSIIAILGIITIILAVWVCVVTFKSRSWGSQPIYKNKTRLTLTIIYLLSFIIWICLAQFVKPINTGFKWVMTIYSIAILGCGIWIFLNKKKF